MTGSPLIDDLYHQYQQKNFQINLYQLREKLKQLKNTKDEIIDLKSANLKHIEWKDDQQINFFISQIQQSQNVSVKKILNIQNYNNQEEYHKVDERELQNQMKSLITKRIHNQELEEVIENEEEKQRKKLIQIYRETRLDQIEPEFKNLNKMNILTVNKMNKAMESQFNKFEYNEGVVLNEQKQFRPHSATQKKSQFKKFWNIKSKVLTTYIDQDNNPSSEQQTDVYSGRYKNNFNQSLTNKSQEFFSQAKEANNTQRTVFLERQRNYSETILRPQTATPIIFQSSVKKKNVVSAANVQKLIKQCKSIEKQNKQKSGKLMNKIDQIDDDLEKSLKMITAIQEQQTLEQQKMDEQFTKYKNQAQFRRKFVSYLVDNLKNKNDILGRQSSEPKRNNFLQDIISQN